MPLGTKDSPNNHRTMQVVNHVRSLLEKGVLQPGDKIPPEREFARSLKISRALVREHYFDGLGPHGSAAAEDTTTTGEPHDH